MANFGLRAIGLKQTINNLRAIQNRYTTQPRYIVGVGAEYGAYVEFGTSRMAAQPYLMPAANHVMGSKFSSLEKQCHSKSDPIEWLLSALATEIEAEAKRRAPVDTGNLRSSIEAFPA